MGGEGEGGVAFTRTGQSVFCLTLLCMFLLGAGAFATPAAKPAIAALLTIACGAGSGAPAEGATAAVFGAGAETPLPDFWETSGHSNLYSTALRPWKITCILYWTLD